MFPDLTGPRVGGGAKVDMSTPKTPASSTLHPLCPFVPGLARILLSTASGEDVDDVITRTSTAVRRALRHPLIQSECDLYTPDLLTLCAVAQFCHASIRNVHKHYEELRAMSSSDELDDIQFDQLKQCHGTAWSHIFPLLNLSTPALNSLTPKPTVQLKRPTSKHKHSAPTTPRRIFSNTHIMLIPSVLLSKTTANTLRMKAEAEGANALVLSPGAGGMAEAQKNQDKLKSNGRVIVVADQALTKRHENKEVSALDEVVPAKWLTDSLKANRFKATSVYSVVTPKREKRVEEKCKEKETAQQPAKKRKISIETPSDFRAEVNTTPGVRRCSSAGDGFHDDERAEGDRFNHLDAFTVATRLFATPKKKVAERQDDDDDSGEDEVKDNIDTESARKNVMSVSTTDLPSAKLTPGSVKKPVTQIKTANSSDVNINSNTATGTRKERVGKGGRWACEIRVGEQQTEFPSNDRICHLLSIVQAAHEAKKDKFRSLGYQKAIARLKTLDFEILCMEDVRRLRKEPNIGGRISDKIAEIVKTGNFRQAESVMNDKQYEALRMLCGVWGIGPVRAMQLANIGVRDITSLRRAVKCNKVILERCQLIGLNRYEDLLLRMPRDLVSDLEMYVRRIAKAVDTSIDATIAGSFLRGKKSCGDADILIHGEGPKVRKAMPLIRARMTQEGILTDDLVEGNGKYFGVFKLPGKPHGRIDLFAVPKEQYPYALLTYTGSAVFNRSMRAKAKSLGYSLSHKGMQRVVRTSNGKTKMEPSIQVDNEREIFEMLDIPYVPPTSRSIS